MANDKDNYENSIGITTGIAAVVGFVVYAATGWTGYTGAIAFGVTWSAVWFAFYKGKF